MKIGVLGGTFDPIHEGHLRLGKCAKDELRLDKVLFVPAFIAPNKSTRGDLTEPGDRCQMVQSALKGCAGFELCDVELSKPEISYTVETLETLKSRAPQDEFFLIMGADTLMEIPTWRDPERIKKLTRFVVAHRGCEPKNFPYPENVHWMKMEPCNVSSTDVRKQIRHGEHVEGLPPEVLAYIRNRKLYRKGS